MPEDTGKKRFIQDFLNNVQGSAGLIGDISIERIVRLPGSVGEGSTAKSLSGRQISTINGLLKDDLKHTFDEGYFTFRFVAASRGSGKTSLLTYLHELTKTRTTHRRHSVLVQFNLSDLRIKAPDFREEIYRHILAHTFYELFHNSDFKQEVRNKSEKILGQFIKGSEFAELKTAENLNQFRNDFKKSIGNNYQDSLEHLLFDIIAEISAIDPKFTFVYLIDDLDHLEKFNSQIDETRLLFKGLIKRASQKFSSKIRLLIYLAGTSANVGSFIADDSVIESLIGDSIINLNKGYNNEFTEIRSKIDDRIQGAYKGYKDFNQAWQEIKDIKINTATTLREFCKKYGSAVLEIHAKYFEQAPEQAFEGDARELVEAQCLQKWSKYLKQKAYKLVVSTTNQTIAGHSFDCYAELKHNGNTVAKAFGEAKNYELIIGHLETFKEWLNDAKFNPFKSDGLPNDLAVMIAPSCSSLLKRKLELANIEYIEAPKVPSSSPSISSPSISSPSISDPPPLDSSTVVPSPPVKWECRHTLTGHLGAVYAVPITADGKTLVTHSREKIILWDMSNFSRILTWREHSDTILNLAITSDSKILASASKDQKVTIWNLETRSLIASLQKYADPIFSVAFSLDGNILASGGSRKYKAFKNNVGIYLWDVNTKKMIDVLCGHSLQVNSLAFSPDGKLLVSGSNDKTIKIWNLQNNQIIRTLSDHSDLVSCVAITPDGKTVVSSGGGGVKIWDLATGNLKITLKSDFNVVRCFAISLDGKILAYNNRNSIQICDLEDYKLIQTMTTNLLHSATLSFHPDGKTLVVGNVGDPVTVWQLS